MPNTNASMIVAGNAVREFMRANGPYTTYEKVKLHLQEVFGRPYKLRRKVFERTLSSIFPNGRETTFPPYVPVVPEIKKEPEMANGSAAIAGTYTTDTIPPTKFERVPPLAIAEEFDCDQLSKFVRFCTYVEAVGGIARARQFLEVMEKLQKTL